MSKIGNQPECPFCGHGGCTLECSEVLTFQDGQQFVANLPHDGDMRTGYKLRTDGTPSEKPIVWRYHKSYFKETALIGNHRVEVQETADYRWGWGCAERGGPIPSWCAAALFDPEGLRVQRLGWQDYHDQEKAK
jgi:hypothetical protein